MTSTVFGIRLEMATFKLLEEARGSARRNDFIKICILEKLARMGMQK